MKLLTGLLLFTFGLVPCFGENVNPKVNAFKTMSPPAGTNPVASSAADTLYFSSADNSCTITGNATSKTLNWACSGGSGNAITALTGDGTAAGPGSSALTLATVNANPGTWGSPSDFTAFTVNAKGLITAVAESPIAITQSQVTGLVSALSGKQASGNYLTALTGDVTASGPGSAAASISASTVTGKVLTGFSASAGTVAATDTILQGFNKLQGAVSLKAPVDSPAFTTQVTFGNYHLDPGENNAGNSSTAQTINWGIKSAQASTLTGNVTYTFSNPQTGGAYVLRVLTGAGGFNATWPANVKWTKDVAPVISSGAGEMDLVNFYYDGTNYYGSFVQGYNP